MLRKDEPEKLLVTGFVDGKQARGRQQEIFLTYLGKMKQKLPMELLQMAKKCLVQVIYIAIYVYEQYT